MTEKVEKISLLVSYDSNYNLLANLLTQYTVQGKKECFDSADLVIMDYHFLTNNRGKLVNTRETTRPLLLPFLLMVSSAEKKMLKQSDIQIADEVLEIPAEKIMIQIRVESLLRLRKFSLESEQHNQLFQFMDRSVPAGICILQEGKIVYANQALCNLLGKDARELHGTSFLNFAHPNHKIKLQKAMEEAQKDEISGYTYESQIATAGGNQCWVDLRFSRIIYNHTPSLIVSMLDITERKLYEQELQFLNLHDQLTGLYNRAFFTEEMQRLQKGRDFPITIIVTDVNGLKFINDSMGHNKGDDLLKACAEVLKSSLRSSDILARVGGDEFAVLLPNTTEQQGENIMQRIFAKLKANNRENPELPLSLAMGQATAEHSKESLEKIFEKADGAMYRDKLYKGEGERAKIFDSLMTALNERDYITEVHVRRLTELCRKIGEKIGLSSRQLGDLDLLARAHDLGKVGIPDKILFKKGPLDYEEWELMKQHPEKGHRIALSSPYFSEIADLILKHHERWDGRGYPLGLIGREIPVECRVLAIIDAYDAMTSERPYHRALSMEEALKELKDNAGSQFDPQLVKTFISILEEENNY